MTPEEAFLEDILAHPEDDTPRLIYSDWLDDRNDPRGEFIRIQVELGRLPDNHPRRSRLEWRCEQLLEQHEKHWLGRVAKLLPLECYRFVWQRGFAAELIGWGEEAARCLARHAGAVLRPFPLDGMRLLPTGGVSGTPLPWDQKADLILDRLRLDDLALLLSAPEISRLILLDLGGEVLHDVEGGEHEMIVSHQLGDAGARLLAGAKHLHGLKELVLSDNLISDAGAWALANSPHLTGLARLDLSHNLISEGLKGLLQHREAGRFVFGD
jgi:uncharacterized protein (TIGR02996 family)